MVAPKERGATMAFTEEEENALRGLLAIERTRSAGYSDDIVILAPGICPEWDGNGHHYAEGERFTFKGEVYYPNQDVVSSAHQTPDGTPTIYVKLTLGADDIPVWSMDALHSDPNIYNTGKRVHYPGADGPIYESRRDGNTSVPGTDEWWVLVDA